MGKLSLSAQTDPLDTLSLALRIKNIPSNSYAIDVDEQKNIYLLSAQACYKYFYATNYDSVISTQGIILQPALKKMRVANQAKIYLLDTLKQTIYLLNANFRLIKAYELGLEYSLTDFDVAPTGEIFLLNTVPLEIIKIDIWGKLERNRTNYELNPTTQTLSITQTDFQNPILYTTAHNQVYLYDLFGQLETSFQPAPLPFVQYILQNKQSFILTPQGYCVSPDFTNKRTICKTFVPALRPRSFCLRQNLLYLLNDTGVYMGIN